MGSRDLAAFPAALLVAEFFAPCGLGGGQAPGHRVQFFVVHPGQARVGQQLKVRRPLQQRGLPGGRRDGGLVRGAAGVVPGAALGVRLEGKCLHAVGADRDAGGIGAGVQGGLDP
ncbi:hypothetical protein EES42_42945 [Streptomyces sp. ADI95-17]|nr:hypothetical protein EES42_42945 [Streptomyces sp. ADI95-17]